MKGTVQRLEFLTRDLSRQQWRLLGALAIERELTLGEFAKLASALAVALPVSAMTSASGGPAEPRRRAPNEEPAAVLLAEWQRLGLVAPVSEAKSRAHDGHFAVHADFAELVLRRLAASGELGPIAEASQRLLGDRTLAGCTLLLQTGRFDDYQRHAFLVPRAAARLSTEIDDGALLFLTVARPFDAAWFEATFGESALSVAQRALHHALWTLKECDGLFHWASQEVKAATGLEDVQVPRFRSVRSLRLTVAEHAVLRGHLELAEFCACAMTPDERWPVDVATRCLSGDLSSALAELQLRADADGPEITHLIPLLVLLGTSRGPSSPGSFKRLLASRGASGAGFERALRTYFRHASQPSAEHARLDVHQLMRGAGAWELVIFGLTVHLYVQQEVTRAAWAVQLARLGAAWTVSGYTWLGRQALLLARVLSPEYFEQQATMLEQQLGESRFQPRARELVLAEVVRAKPAWERALESLSELTLAADFAQEQGSRRVAWYLNLSSATLERPALQELKRGVWTRGRRLPLSSLYELIHELPEEDQRVLAATREVTPDRREYLPEALEALIGHPRVASSERSDVRVEVIRGTPRIETREERGGLTIAVEPRGARLGINVVVEGESRVIVHRVTPALQRVLEVLPEGILVPRERQSEALNVLARLSRGIEVRSPHLGADREIPADATPCLRVVPEGGSWLVQVGILPFGAEGRFFFAGAGKTQLSWYTKGERRLCTRDLNSERAAVSRLILACPSLLERRFAPGTEQRQDSGESWDFGESELLALLLEVTGSGEPHLLEWPESPPVRLRGTVSSPGLHGSLRRSKGWYLVTGGATLSDGTELAIAELMGGQFVAGGRFVRLPSGDYVAIEQRIQSVIAALAAAEPLGDTGTLRLHQGAIEALRDLASGEGGRFQLDPDSREWLDRTASLETHLFPVPTELTADLRPYQYDGFRWLSRLAALGLGACLADDMGLGKTVQLLALLLTRRDSGPALVIAPTSVCSNWLQEALRFAPALRVVEYAGPERASLLGDLARLPEGVSRPGAPHVIVCSYGLLQQDIDELAAIAWGTVVLDEAQFIKNAQSLRAQAAQKLHAPCRIVATGTPIENHLGDLWSLFNFINPGLLGSWRSFQHRFLRPIEQREDGTIREQLQALIKPFVLRRTKAEVLTELPALTVVDHVIVLSDGEARGYGLLKQQIQEKLRTAHGRRDNKLEILAEITRLRRYCCHPRLVFPHADVESAKLQALVDLVVELRESEHRALVFSQYVDFLELVRERLDEVGVSYQYLDGATPRAERAARVKAFQAGEGTLFLISLKAGGFGLNLTAADYVIHLDPWWNPAVEAQATDRAHRLGQLRPVTVYRLITHDTIEESIVALHTSKRLLADGLLQGGDEPAALSASELIGLIEQGAVGSALGA